MNNCYFQVKIKEEIVVMPDVDATMVNVKLENEDKSQLSINNEEIIKALYDEEENQAEQNDQVKSSKFHNIYQ